MKRFITTFLVAGLMITSALSLNSCKKTNTNADAKEWIPTTYDFVMSNNPLSRDPVVAICPYDSLPVPFCNHNVNWWNRDPVTNEMEICPDGPWDPIVNPNGHYHEHRFRADEDCTPPGQHYYICPHKGSRWHRHIVVYWQAGWDNHWHLGGAIGD